LLLANSSGADDDHHHHQQVDTTTTMPMTMTTSLPPASYMSMRQDLLHDDESNNMNATELHARNGNGNGNGNDAAAATGGYIKPTQMKNWSTTDQAATAAAASLPMSMPLSGYVPVKMLQTHGMPALPPVAALAPAPVAAPTAAISTPPQQHLLNSSNYVQASDLHKLKPPTVATTTTTPTLTGATAPVAIAAPAPTVANSFGYTSMEQLQRGGAAAAGAIMKPTSPSPLQTLPNYTTQPVGQTGQQQQQLNRLQPQIGGYVTPQDLNAIAHNRHML